MPQQSIEVIPGIFEKDFRQIEERVRLVAPLVDWIQIDIADGKLVPNTSFVDSAPFKKLLLESRKNFELHMMVDEPFEIANEWIGAGFRRLIFHIEALNPISNYKLRITSTIQELHKLGIEVGLAVDRDTPVESLFPYLDDIDSVLVMTIKAGFSGQNFMPELLGKVKALRGKKPHLPIEVDGGINDQTARLAINAGANRLVSTSYIFSSEQIEEAIEKLKKM